MRGLGSKTNDMNTLLSEPREATEAAPTPGRRNPSPRILVVDDANYIRQLMASFLTRFGYQVDTAEDGVAGWKALQANHYDLLLTDNNMPRLSGIDLIKRLRFARMNLPVILGVTLFGAFFVLVANLLVDVIYGLTDPKVTLK